MATSPFFPKSNLTWPIETLRRGVSFVWVRASVRLSTATLFRLGVMACTVLTFGLGFLLWDRFPFREDEALYAYWALHFARIDPWFLTVWPDKPPLFLWSLAGIFDLLGPSAAAARLLNIAITGLTVPVVAAIARRLWGQSAGLWAAITFALNPFVLSFAPTAYTDPMLVLWGMVALYAALARRPLWAGIALGAAIMTKQQGVLFVPLVGMALINAQGTMDNAQWGWGKAKGKRLRRELSAERQSAKGFDVSSQPNGKSGWADTQSPIPNPQSLLPALLGVAAIILPIIFWDSRRWAVAPSPWDLAVGNYGRLTLLAPDLWLSRWQTWGGLIWQLAGSWAVWVGLAAGFVLIKAKSKKLRRELSAERQSAKGFDVSSQPNGKSGWADTHSPLPNPQSLLPLWTLGFLALHLFTTVQPWDRYLLSLAPMLALLAGWMGHRLTQLNGRRVGAILGLAWILLLLPTGLTAAQGGTPLGGDHGDYAGLDSALAWVQANAPADAVLYHQELGPQLEFYLFGKTLESGGAYDLRWTPSAVYLADNAAKTPDRPKFMILPDWAADRSQSRYLPMRGMVWLPRFHAGKFTVYEIMSQPTCGDAKYSATICSSRVRDPARAMGLQPGGTP